MQSSCLAFLSEMNPVWPTCSKKPWHGAMSLLLEDCALAFTSTGELTQRPAILLTISETQGCLEQVFVLQLNFTKT